MNNREEDQPKYPFKVSFDERVDQDSVTIRIKFRDNAPDRKELETTVKEWAEKGKEQGYDGKMYYLDDEPDEYGEGGFEWSDAEKWVEFFVDMGSSGPKAYEELFGRLSTFAGIEEIMIGSGYYW